MKTIKGTLALGLFVFIITMGIMIAILQLIDISLGEPATIVITTSVFITCCFRMAVDIWEIKKSKL